MSALKGRQISAFLAKPDLTTGLVVVYGPDAGLVTENGAALCSTIGGDDRDAVTTFSMSEIEADAQRLGIEARTPSLFGTGRVIRVRGATNKITATLAELLDDGASVCFIIEAGDLKPADSLRKLAEKRADARALPCYGDTAQSIDALIRESLASASITTEPDLVPVLRDMLGNDRQVTRREIEKLVLFAGEGGTLSRADVIALCGDNAALAIDQVLDAIGTGHAKRFDDAMTRALAAGTDAQRLLIAALGHFLRLRAMRAETDAGATPDQVIGRAVPRVHFSRKDSVAQQLRMWSDEALANACARLATAMARTRKMPALAQADARQAMLAVCLAAARR